MRKKTRTPAITAAAAAVITMGRAPLLFCVSDVSFDVAAEEVVGCAAAAVQAALEAASMNVFVNTRMLPEDGEAGALEEQASDLLREYLPRSREISDAVMRSLRAPK